MNEWTATLGSLTIGAGTAYELTKPITGLGEPQPAGTGEAARGDRDGVVSGPDVLPKRQLGFTFDVAGSSPENAVELWLAAQSAWRKRSDDVALTLRLPGVLEEGWTFFGRPRGTTPTLDALKSGTLELVAIFDALDPRGYGAEVELDPDSGTFTVDTLGGFDTDRATVLIVGDGGTPRFENATDDGHFVSWSTTLAGGDVRIIDLRRQRVTDGTGVSKDEEISTSSLWPMLLAGENELELTGAASAAVTFRPALL